MPNPTTPPPIQPDDPAGLKPFTAADTVGDIVARLPEAAAVFREARIDYCCGGKKTLGEALQKRGLDVQPFLDELNRLLSEATSPEDGRRADWRTEPLSCLVDHIVRRHRAYLEHELPELAAAVTKLLRVHGDAHPELAELHRTFHELKADLEQHLFTEEKRLFPLVRRAESSGDAALYAEAARLIDELERDHENAGRKLAEMRDITRDYQLPADACRTYADTFARLDRLEADMHEHVHLENNVLFPRVLAAAGIRTDGHTAAGGSGGSFASRHPHASPNARAADDTTAAQKARPPALGSDTP